ASTFWLTSSTSGCVSSGRVANGLDVVTIRIKHKSAVVIRVVLGPQAGRAIVLGAGRNRCAIERVDCGPALPCDSNVHGAVEPALAPHPEVRFAVDAEARGRTIAFVLPHLHDEHIPERLECLLIEGF